MAVVHSLVLILQEDSIASPPFFFMFQSPGHYFNFIFQDHLVRFEHATLRCIPSLIAGTHILIPFSLFLAIPP